MLEDLKTRVTFRGKTQLERMNIEKVKTLKKALYYSYQAATAKLADGREFKCLINRDKLSVDLDEKIISIPFEDLCLTTNTNEKIGMKEGDVFEWKENGSHWIVFLKRLEETAYFRADIRRCRHEIKLGNGSVYWGYIRGPVEQQLLWSQASGNYYNKLNYTLLMYVTNNEETRDCFKRFDKVMVAGRPWTIEATDDISTPGLIQIHLKETFLNTPETDIETAVEMAKSELYVDIIPAEEDPVEEVYIYGMDQLFPYDKRTYELRNYEGKKGTWSVKNESKVNIVKLINENDNQVTVEVLTGRSGKFTLVYTVDTTELAKLDITIDSL